jgi:hypothetical protein
MERAYSFPQVSQRAMITPGNDGSGSRRSCVDEPPQASAHLRSRGFRGAGRCGAPSILIDQADAPTNAAVIEAFLPVGVKSRPTEGERYEAHVQSVN